MSVKDAVLFGLIIILFGMSGKSIYLYRDTNEHWSHDDFRIACLEYSNDYPDLKIHYEIVDHVEFPFKCMDKDKREWFSWQ